MTNHARKFIPASFFDPVFNGGGKVDTDHLLYRFFYNCDMTPVAIYAMATAREEGRLNRIENLEGRDFPAAESWNKFADHMDASDRDRHESAHIIVQHLRQIVGNDLYSKNAISGTNHQSYDVDAMKRALPKLIAKLNAFLDSPKVHNDERKLPRGSDHIDRMNEGGLCYLVQIWDWHPELLVRPAGEGWSKARDLLLIQEEPAERNPADEIYSNF